MFTAGSFIVTAPGTHCQNQNLPLDYSCFQKNQRGEVVDVSNIVQLFLRSTIGEMLQWYSIISKAMIVFFQEEYLQRLESQIGSISTLIHRMMFNVIKHMFFFNMPCPLWDLWYLWFLLRLHQRGDAPFSVFIFFYLGPSNNGLIASCRFWFKAVAIEAMDKCQD